MDTQSEITVAVVCNYCGRPTGRQVRIAARGGAKYTPAASGGICKQCRARNAAGLPKSVRRKLGW